MSKEIDKLEILTEICKQYDVSFSGVESNAIIAVMDKWRESKVKKVIMELEKIKDPIGKLIIDSGLGEMTQDGLYLHYTDVITMMKKYAEAGFIQMQKCPKCDGQGIVSKPPWIAGDQTTWDDSTSTSHQCNVCNGQKIIPMQKTKK